MVVDPVVLGVVPSISNALPPGVLQPAHQVAEHTSISPLANLAGIATTAANPAPVAPDAPQVARPAPAVFHAPPLPGRTGFTSSSASAGPIACLAPPVLHAFHVVPAPPVLQAPLFASGSAPLVVSTAGSTTLLVVGAAAFF